ncbi:GH11419 [Drosophila grimshawi]|nr:GH11419 [Drosophila grimshawi]
MDPQQQFCLKWNSYSSNLAITFSNLFKSDLLADVTLSCDGAVFRAHKLILAACSKKFADLFENTPTNGQCVIILEATTPDNMAALLEFMYKGEVHVSQEALNSFLKSAESLQVKGLSTETGRLAAQQAQQQHMGGDSSPLDSPTGRRNMRNSLSGSGGGNNNNNNSGIGIGLGGANSGAIAGNGLSLAGALSGMAAAGGMAAAASVAASGLSALAASAGALDRCGSAGGNIISGSASSVGPMSTGSAAGVGGGNNVGVGGGNNGPISLGSSVVAMHLGGSTGSLKQECDSLMHPSSSTSLGAMSGYVPPMYHRPMSFNEPLRKRALRSPFAEQELRGSVLRDGSKNSSECPSPINKPPYHRPSSSASSTAPTEADTMHSERASPQSSRYENHSPSTTAGNGNAPSSLDRIVKSERNNGSANEANDDERELMDESTDNGAEDLRVKLENSSFTPPKFEPNSNTSSTTPNALLENLKNADGSLSGNLAASIAPADMLNVWNATKMNNKNSVNTADGKKLKCLYCDRLYGYETNLRAHIRQRHQGIRVPCPFCERTFTRNNTVRRHIAREHKQEIGLAAGATIAPAHVAAAAAAAAAANHSP